MIINAGRPGKKLPTLTNPGVAGDLLTGKELIGQDGQIITGTMASVVQATPTISVSTGGLITASATQSAGRVASGTKSTTHQLTTQAGKTVTPGTTQQTAVASGRYTTGPVYVAGSSNLVASNIKQGVNIFGVTGTYAPFHYKTVCEISSLENNETLLMCRRDTNSFNDDWTVAVYGLVMKSFNNWSTIPYGTIANITLIKQQSGYACELNGLNDSGAMISAIPGDFHVSTTSSYLILSITPPSFWTGNKIYTDSYGSYLVTFFG